MAPAEAALAAVAAGITAADPGPDPAVQPRRRARSTHGREMLQRLVRAGHRAGPLGPVHAHAGRPRGHRRDRAAPGRHPGRAGQAGAQGHGAPEIVTLNTPDDLPAARDLIARHGGGAQPRADDRSSGWWSPPPPAPSSRPAEPGRGRRVRPARSSATSSTRQGPVEVTAHDSGLLTEWLAHHDDPVAPGQPLARIGGHALNDRQPDRRAAGTTSPRGCVTNDDLAQMVDTNDEWIRDRVGIATRRIAGATRRSPTWPPPPPSKALANSGPHRRRHRPGRGRHLLLGRPHARTWPARVAAKLGITAPAAFDLNTACSGFSYALGTVDHAIRAGAARNAIVIGAEKLSDFTDWTDRSTCIIFGDGAGAAVVTATADGRAGRDRPGGLGLRAGEERRGHGSRAGARTSRRRGRRSSAGPPPRWPRWPCRPASGPASTRRSSPRSCRTRPTCASSTASRSG